MRSLVALVLTLTISAPLVGCHTPPVEVPEQILERQYRILDTVTGLAYNGYHIVHPDYEVKLACSKQWGYYSLEVIMGGERLAYTRNFIIQDQAGNTLYTPQKRYQNLAAFVSTAVP